MDYTSIHETAFRDIVDLVVDAAKDVGEKAISDRKKTIKSITSASSALVLTFPVACSRNISPETASMMSKAIERKCASLLQILFNALQLTSAEDAFEFVKSIHTNINMPEKGAGDYTDMLINFSKNGINFESADFVKMEAAVMADMKNINYYLPSSISENALNDFVINHSSSGLPKVTMASKALQEAKGAVAAGSGKEIISVAKTYADMTKATTDIIKNQLMDSDIKKANELQPTMMYVNFIQTGGDAKGSSVPVIGTFVLGVKARLVPIDSEDIINRIDLKVNDRNSLLSLVKATTREISFWKDFIFAVDRAKLDALSQSKKGGANPLWKILERRSLKSKIRRTLGQRNDATAITTLVVSQEEVDYIRKNKHIDLENVSICRGLMESLNLMGITIIDETIEVAKMLWDTGDANFENMSFKHLEREASDGSYKKMINLMARMR